MATKDQSEFKYLVANDRDRLWGITVTSVGFQRIDADEAYPPADHPAGYYFNVTAGRVLDEYQLIYVVDGEGVFESDGKTYALAPGAMFLIFPGCWHTYRPNRKTGWGVYWIGFRGKVVDERVAGGFFSGRSPVYNVGISTLAIDVYRGAMQAAGQEGPYYQQMLSGAVSLLMGVALNLNSGRKSPNDETCDKIARAKVIMRDNLSENISAQEVARRLHVSYSWFRTAFKRHAGMAAGAVYPRTETVPGDGVAFRSGDDGQGGFLCVGFQLFALFLQLFPQAHRVQSAGVPLPAARQRSHGRSARLTDQKSELIYQFWNTIRVRSFYFCMNEGDRA